MKWVEEQNVLDNLPKIDGIREVTCTSPRILITKTETTAIYIIQMNCQYDEEQEEQKCQKNSKKK